MHSTPLNFILGSIITTVILALFLLVLKRFISLSKAKVKKVLRYLILLYIVAVIGSGLMQYFIFWSKPQSFQQAIKLLENDKFVTSRIGTLNGYSYTEYKLPKSEENPARLEITLLGSKADMFVDVILMKDEHTDEWSIQRFLKDSLLVKQP